MIPCHGPGERTGRVLGGISPTLAAAGIMPWKPSVK